MRSRWLLWLLLLLLITLGLAAGYLLFRNRTMEQPRVTQAPLATPYVITLPKRVAANSPVIKRVNADGKSAAYIVHGSLIAPLERQPNLLVGQFVIKDDPRGRVIPIMFGSAGREVQVGLYDGSFAGDSQWRSYPLDEAASLIPLSKDVELWVNLSLDQGDESFATHRELERQWDGLIEEYYSGQFTNSAPNMSWLVVNSVGVVR